MPAINPAPEVDPAAPSAPDSLRAVETGFVQAASLRELEEKRALMVRVGRKQIALFATEKGVYACNNRCPHEGYPLKEGSMSDGCVLTCNWHNWKFDLESGETLIGGDKLRRYPVQIRGDEVWLDVTDPPAAKRAAAAMAALRETFVNIDRRMEYDRLAREIARLQRSQGDPLDAVRAAIDWTHERFEYGTTHAVPAAADWLTLRAGSTDGEAARLVPLVEIAGHFAWDSLRQPVYVFPKTRKSYDEGAFLEAIEREDEDEAIALLRGALELGLGYRDLERPLATAALAHYADFGHSLIYVAKTGELIAQLGRKVQEPLLLMLVRSLVNAYREDLIPEFRGYHGALADWAPGKSGAAGPAVEDLTQRSVKQVLTAVSQSAADPEDLWSALFGASAWNLAHFDAERETLVEVSVAQSVGWLDFTHAVTFGNAVRTICEKHSELWPQGLLQMGCFVGRNAADVDGAQDLSAWRIPDAEAFFRTSIEKLFDHGQFEYIVSSHLLKTFMAAREEYLRAPEAPWAGDLLSGVNRFLNTPIKRKHALRIALQSLEFVAAED